MTQEDFANMIRLARRAPLANMDEAEAAATLLQKFAAHATSYNTPVEAKGDGKIRGSIDKDPAQ